MNNENDSQTKELNGFKELLVTQKQEITSFKSETKDSKKNEWLKKELDRNRQDSDEIKIKCKTQASSIQFLDKNNSE